MADHTDDHGDQFGGHDESGAHLGEHDPAEPLDHGGLTHDGLDDLDPHGHDPAAPDQDADTDGGHEPTEHQPVEYDLPEHAGGHDLDGDLAAGHDLQHEPSHELPENALFPEPLHTEVLPADGLPWVEPALLGSGSDAVAGGNYSDSDGDQLIDYAPHEQLVADLDVDDPAGRALAAFWTAD